MTENQEKDTVTLTQVAYKQLVEDSQFLDALRAAGVDNWDGYDIAHEIQEEWENE